MGRSLQIGRVRSEDCGSEPASSPRRLGVIEFLDHSSWVTGNDRVRRDILCHHAGGAHNGVFTDSDAAKQSGTGADRSSSLDQCRNALPVLLGLKLAAICSRARVKVVDERNVMPDKDFVLESDSFAQKGVTRDFATVADFHPLLNFDKVSDLCIISYLA